MHKFLFTGPTISLHDIQNMNVQTPVQKISSVYDFKNYGGDEKDRLFVLPPVSGGDLCHIHDHPFPFLVAIVDGYFENRISVWHREILFLLSKNIPVFGASSMGALRAAELNSYGMIGVGEIYQKFSSCEYEDDDEVTINHGPQELGYPQISEAMANIRFTIEAAIQDNILTLETGVLFLSVAKSTFYKRRNYGSIIRQCIDHEGMKESDFSKFSLWLQKHRVDQKKKDAQELVRLIDTWGNARSMKKPSFIFHDTVMWRSSIKPSDA